MVVETRSRWLSITESGIKYKYNSYHWSVSTWGGSVGRFRVFENFRPSARMISGSLDVENKGITNQRKVRMRDSNPVTYLKSLQKYSFSHPPTWLHASSATWMKKQTVYRRLSRGGVEAEDQCRWNAASRIASAAALSSNTLSRKHCGFRVYRCLSRFQTCKAPEWTLTFQGPSFFERDPPHQRISDLNIDITVPYFVLLWKNVLQQLYQFHVFYYSERTFTETHTSLRVSTPVTEEVT